MYITAFIATLLSASAIAAPADTNPAGTLAKRIPRGQQTCSSTRMNVFDAYNVNVGAQFRAEYCGKIRDNLHGHAIADTNFQCLNDGAGGFRLYFNTPIEQAAKVNAALHDSFQDITFTCV